MSTLTCLVLLALPTATTLDPADIIEVKAKLLEIPGKLPPNELYDYAYVMKYEVMGGQLDKQRIYVAHFNPRVARKKIKGDIKKYAGGKLKRFREGDLHQMKLHTRLESIWTDAVMDEYFAVDRTSTRYWCLEVNPAE